MTRDFKIGLISGAVLAFVALVWVVTRPTLSPQARMLGPRSSSAQDQEPPVTDPIRQAASQPPAQANLGGPLPSEDPGGPTAPEPEPIEPAAAEPNQGPASPPTGIDSTIYERQEKIKTTKFHIVLKDQTLSAISQQHYGTPNQWRKIVEANRDTIKNPNKITPGTKLIIPD